MQKQKCSLPESNWRPSDCTKLGFIHNRVLKNEEEDSYETDVITD